MATLSDVEKKIMARARDFDLQALYRLLLQLGYPKERIWFESNPDDSTGSGIVHAVRFVGNPSPLVRITVNTGLLGENSPLPSYFFALLEQARGPEPFFDFIHFFDHKLIHNLLLATNPELNEFVYGDWEQVQASYVRMLGRSSVCVLHWLFQLYLPELVVRVERMQKRRTTSEHGFETGRSSLDGSGVIGEKMEYQESGFAVTLIAADPTHPGGKAWPLQALERISKSILPQLEDMHRPLRVEMVLPDNTRFARLDGRGYLGFDRLADETTEGLGIHRILLHDS